jgi:hypothetical protein
MGDIRALHSIGNDEAGPRLGAMARGILVGGSVAGIVDIFAATAINGVEPGFILQFIASGLLGKASFHGGLMTIALGLVLQLAMSLIIAAIYGLASTGLPVLIRRPVSMGALFGVGVFIVMTFVVMPLSAAAHPKHPPSVTAILLNLAAMILFGLIVSAAQSRAVAKRG